MFCCKVIVGNNFLVRTRQFHKLYEIASGTVGGIPAMIEVKFEPNFHPPFDTFTGVCMLQACLSIEAAVLML